MAWVVNLDMQAKTPRPCFRSACSIFQRPVIIAENLGNKQKHNNFFYLFLKIDTFLKVCIFILQFQWYVIIF